MYGLILIGLIRPSTFSSHNARACWSLHKPNVSPQQTCVHRLWQAEGKLAGQLQAGWPSKSPLRLELEISGTYMASAQLFSGLTFLLQKMMSQCC